MCVTRGKICDDPLLARIVTQRYELNYLELNLRRYVRLTGPFLTSDYSAFYSRELKRNLVFKKKKENPEKGKRVEGQNVEMYLALLLYYITK